MCDCVISDEKKICRLSEPPSDPCEASLEDVRRVPWDVGISFPLNGCLCMLAADFSQMLGKFGGFRLGGTTLNACL